MATASTMTMQSDSNYSDNAIAKKPQRGNDVAAAENYNNQPINNNKASKINLFYISNL